MAGALGRVGHALRDHAGPVHTVATGRPRPAGDHLDLGHLLELLGVDDRALPGQRHRAAGVAGAAAARDDGQAQLDAAGLTRRPSRPRCRASAPRRGTRRASRWRRSRARRGQAVELDVVLGGVRGPAPCGCACAGCDLAESGAAKRSTASRGQLPAARPPWRRARIGCGCAALLDLAQAVVQRVDQQRAALGVVQQVVFR
jgi:hypothetical protein